MEKHEDAGTADREKPGTVMNGLVKLKIEKEINWNSSKNMIA